MAEGMTGTVKVPGMGAVKKKTALYGGLAALAGVLGVWWYRQRKAKQAGTTAGTPPVSPVGSDLYPPDGTTGDPTDPYSTDPNTGMTYGDEAAGQSAGVGFGSFFPGGSNTDTTGTTAAAVPGPGTFTSNAQWASYVEQAMGSTGADAIAAAMGKYITGGDVTDAQRTSIDEAIAIGEYPPTPGPGGFPPSIKTKGGSHPVTAHNPVKGLKASPGFTSVTLKWDAEPHAAHYLASVLGGGKVVEQQTVTGTTARLGNLKSGHHYTARVRAQPGGAGGTDATAAFTTK